MNGECFRDSKGIVSEAMFNLTIMQNKSQHSPNSSLKTYDLHVSSKLLSITFNEVSK